VRGSGGYRTPLRNLYLCGAGTHPGGGVSGANGMNAAKVVLKDLKRQTRLTSLEDFARARRRT
jgi:phytoene dehydrogenase-like protein